MLENATPFFWLNLERFYDAVTSGDDLTLATRRLLVSAFDPHLIEGAMPVPDVAGHVLPNNDPMLFEDSYRDQILTECDPRFPTYISGALNLIRTADPELGERIAESILWYVPIASPDAATHCSFTSPRLHGVTFLSQNDDVLRLAEALVHEFGHTELNVLMSVISLTGDITPDELFYSPWRSDPRPLAGLFHGLYVFSEVFSFLGRLATRHLSDSGVVLQRMTIIAHRLRLGLAQVPHSRLDPLGREIMEEIEANVSAQARKLGIIFDDVPPLLGDHMQEWLSNHPKLALRVPAI
jgi:hypothetical protein